MRSSGRPQRSFLAYKGTGTGAALERLLARGGVIGGSSAGTVPHPQSEVIGAIMFG